MHLRSVYAWKGVGRGAFPVAERSGDRLLGSPIGPHLDDPQIAIAAEAVVESIAAASRR